jgi:hypothetical protein
MKGSAVFSEDGVYRYRLERTELLRSGPSDRFHDGAANFIMLNPSTATADASDPTVRRCEGFARAWGYDRLIVTNLFGHPAKLLEIKAWCDKLEDVLSAMPKGAWIFVASGAPYVMAKTPSGKRYMRRSGVDSAAIVTSSLPSKSCHILIGSISVRASRKNNDTGTLSNEDINAINAPAMTPGRIKGRVTKRKLYQRLAPKLAELSSNAGSICVSAADVVRMTYGTHTAV